jgi:integrase
VTKISLGPKKVILVGYLNSLDTRAYNTCHVNAVFIISVRAGEALSIRIKDLDLDSNPSKLFVRREYAKTRTDTTIFLTDEVAHQLKSWLDYKYRTRRIYHTGEQN